VTLAPAALAALLLAAPAAAPASAPVEPIVAAPDVSPSEAFERGRTAFGRGEYARAIELLDPLLHPEVRLETEGEVVQAHRMLGVAHLFENQPEDARREFRKLLELRPEYRFDPLLDPPRVVDFFNAVVKQEEEDLSAIEAKRKKREAEQAARRAREAEKQRAREVLVVHVERHSYALSLFPFGAGQFQNGETRKGWFFLGTEAALAAISVGAFVTNFALYGVAPRRRCLVTPGVDMNGLPMKCPDNEIDHTDEDTSRNLLRLQVGSGALFFAVAAWGIVDAVRNFKRDVPLGPDGPPPPQPQSAKAGAAASDFRLSATPFGVGASFRF
jgi:hypothetical protein